MPFRYFLIDPSIVKPDLTIDPQTIAVIGEVEGARLTDAAGTDLPAGLIDGVDAMRVTAPAGTPIGITAFAGLNDTDSPGVIDPVFDGVVRPEVLGYVALLRLEDGSLILTEYLSGGDDVSLDGESPDAFVLSAQATMTTAGTFSVDPFDGAFGSSPVCFAAGTRIATPAGEVAVEWLRPGDLVLTDDGAVLPVLWAGGRRLSGAVLAANPKWAPIRIAPGALGPGVPARPLVLSPQHRVLLAGPMTLRHGGQAPVLAPARGLLGLPGVRKVFPADGISYHHLLLPRHAVILAEATPAESLLPTQRALASLSPAQRAEVRALIARHRLTPEPAHPCLRVGEVRGMLPRRFDGPAGVASRLARRGALLDGAA